MLDPSAERAEDGDEVRERGAHERGGFDAEGGERGLAEPGLQSPAQAGHGTGVAENPFRWRPIAIAGRRRWRGGARELALECSSAAALIGTLEQQPYERLRLLDGQAAAEHDIGRATLVATWQPGEDACGARREQTQPNVGLQRVVERLREQEPATNPGLVAAEELADLRLVERVVAIQGADEPRLLQLGQAGAVVEQPERHLGRGRVIGDHVRAQRAESELTRRVQALEAVEHLERAGRAAVGRHRGQLSVTPERHAHLAHGARAAQPQPAQAVAEIVERDRRRVERTAELGRGRRSHEATPSRPVTLENPGA